MTRNFTLFFFLLFSVSLSSQEADSILINFQKKIENSKTPQLKIKHLYDAGRHYIDKDLHKSESFFLKSKNLIKNDKNPIYGKLYSKLGIVERRKGNFDKSLRYQISAKEFYESRNDSLKLFIVYQQIANIYRYLKNFSKVRENYMHAYEIAKKLNKKDLLAESYHSFGFYFLEDYMLNSTTNNLYKLDSSLCYFNKSITTHKSVKNYKKINRAISNKSRVYDYYKSYNKAIQIRNEALIYYKKENNLLLLSSIYYNNGSSYKHLKKYATALKYIDSSLFISLKEGYKHKIAKSYRLKAEILSDINNHKAAYTNFLLHKKYSDTIFDIKIQEKIKTIELKNEFNIERKELELLKNKEENQKKLYITLLLAFLFSSIIISYLIWKNIKAKNKIVNEKIETEELKKEILAQKVKTSESELKSLIADNSMRLEFLKQLTLQIKEHNNTTKSSTVKKYTNTLLLKLKQQIITENKLSLLQDKIKATNLGFDKKIITLYPNLTKTEREVCAFLRLNLSIKEIASIRNSSTDSIKAVRYRIRKKLNISKGQELESFIQTL